jgi:uncharacterized protein DUF4136
MTTESKRAQALLRGLALAGCLAILTACASSPVVRTQSVPDLNIQRYQSFGFVEHPDTDKSGYTTLTTRFLKDAVAREMVARGYTRSDQQPDLLVNFTTASKDKVEGDSWPDVGLGWGRWSRGWGWGGTWGGQDIRTVTEGSLTIDVVDPQHKELIWSGTAKGRVTSRDEDNPQSAIDKAVAAIFTKYPKPPLVAGTDNR